MGALGALVNVRRSLLVVAALVAVTGCATIQRHQAASFEHLLAAAGFQMRPDDTPEWSEDLKSMPPRTLVARSRNGTVIYIYSDPDACHCLYVGGPKEYSTFERLRVERAVDREEDEAAMGQWWRSWGFGPITPSPYTVK